MEYLIIRRKAVKVALRSRTVDLEKIDDLDLLLTKLRRCSVSLAACKEPRTHGRPAHGRIRRPSSNFAPGAPPANRAKQASRARRAETRAP